MTSIRTIKRKLQLATVAGLVMLTAGGCNRPQQKAVEDLQGPDPSLFADDIFKIVCFYPPNMWQSFDREGDTNPEGFAFVMYPLSRATSKGAYAKGTLHVWMYVIEKDGAGRRNRRLARDWTVPMAQLAPRSKTKFGVGYDVYLHWGSADVYGKEAEIVVQYESPRGRLVQSQTRRAKVPPLKTGT